MATKGLTFETVSKLYHPVETMGIYGVRGGFTLRKSHKQSHKCQRICFEVLSSSMLLQPLQRILGIYAWGPMVAKRLLRSFLGE